MNDEPQGEKDSLDFTPEMMLEDCLKDMRANDQPPQKAFTILLWDEPDGSYSTQFYCAGMCRSQIVALLAKVQFEMLHKLCNYPDNREGQM